jgi:hypothetical protein
MSWDAQPESSSQYPESRHARDRFLRRGEDLIQEAALAAISKHRSLPPRQAETFASTFARGIDKLNMAQDKLTESHKLMPSTLPEPLVEPKLRVFPNSRKRAMTGREAAEEQERDEARQRRRAAIQAQEIADENAYWASQIRAETLLR